MNTTERPVFVIAIAYDLTPQDAEDIKAAVLDVLSRKLRNTAEVGLRAVFPAVGVRPQPEVRP